MFGPYGAAARPYLDPSVSTCHEDCTVLAIRLFRDTLTCSNPDHMLQFSGAESPARGPHPAAKGCHPARNYKRNDHKKPACYRKHAVNREMQQSE